MSAPATGAAPPATKKARSSRAGAKAASNNICDTSIDSVDMTNQVMEHKHGISELSDITLVADTAAGTHHYLLHKQVLATYSNYFKLVFTGDTAVTTLLLPSIITEQLADFEWLLSMWYSHRAKFIINPLSRQLEVGDVVIWDTDLFRVTAIRQPHVHIEWLATPGYHRYRSHKFTLKAEQTWPIRRTMYGADLLAQYEQARRLLPLAIYLDCTTLIKECEDLIVNASSNSCVDVASKVKDIRLLQQYGLNTSISQMITDATHREMHATVAQLIEFLHLAEELKLTDVAESIFHQSDVATIPIQM